MIPYFNKTFNQGAPELFNLNACVGINGMPGMKSYAYGYAQAVTILIDAHIERQEGDVDGLVYPVVFCARHQLELFLKDQIEVVARLRANVTTQSLEITHDLGALWQQFCQLVGQTDRRFLPLVDQLHEFVDDFANIDPTGQTFRYPKNIDSVRHLERTPIINLKVFGDRFKKMNALIEEFITLGDWLTREYRVRTVTAKLSRFDLEDIAKSLPPKVRWVTEELTAAKTAISEKYGLGSRDFQKACDIIKEHAEFGAHIGLRKELRGLTQQALDRLNDVFNGRLDIADMPKEELVAFDVAYDMNMSGVYSEDFDRLFDSELGSFALGRYQHTQLARWAMNMERLGRGLRTLGQWDLADYAVGTVDAKPYIAARKKLSDEFDAKLANLKAMN